MSSSNMRLSRTQNDSRRSPDRSDRGNARLPPRAQALHAGSYNPWPRKPPSQAGRPSRNWLCVTRKLSRCTTHRRPHPADISNPAARNRPCRSRTDNRDELKGYHKYQLFLWRKNGVGRWRGGRVGGDAGSGGGVDGGGGRGGGVREKTK